MVLTFITEVTFLVYFDLHLWPPENSLEKKTTLFLSIFLSRLYVTLCHVRAKIDRHLSLRNDCMWCIWPDSAWGYTMKRPIYIFLLEFPVFHCAKYWNFHLPCSCQRHVGLYLQTDWCLLNRKKSVDPSSHLDVSFHSQPALGKWNPESYWLLYLTQIISYVISSLLLSMYLVTV